MGCRRFLFENDLEETNDEPVAGSFAVIEFPSFRTAFGQENRCRRLVLPKDLATLHAFEEVFGVEYGPLSERFVGQLLAPVVCHRNEGELVEGGGQDLWAFELSGKQDSRGGLRNDVGYARTIVIRNVLERNVGGGHLPQGFNLSLLDVVVIECRRPVVADQLDKTAMERLDQILVHQSDDAGNGKRGVRIIALEKKRAGRDLIRCNHTRKSMKSSRRVVQITEEQRKIFRLVPMHLDERHSVVDIHGSCVGVCEEVGKRGRMVLQQEPVDAEEGMFRRFFLRSGGLLDDQDDVAVREVQIGVSFKDGVCVHLLVIYDQLDSY